MPDIFPASDADCINYLLNLSLRITERPSAYGYSSMFAATLAQAVESFAAAYRIANTEATRNRGTVASKQLARIAAVATGRMYVRQIKADLGVSIEDKVLAGVPINAGGGGTPIPPPNTSPELSIVAATPGAQTVAWRDSMDPNRRARPYGVKALNLYRVVGPAPETDWRKAQLIQGYTRGPVGWRSCPTTTARPRRTGRAGSRRARNRARCRCR